MDSSVDAIVETPIQFSNEPVEEYESSFYIIISQHIYKELLMKNPSLSTEMILYYLGGTRISGDKVQYKAECDKSHLLKYYCSTNIHNPIHFFPMTRKHCQEYTVMMPQDISKIERVIVRHNIAIEQKKKDYITIRISLERCFGSEGGHYALTGEIEYSKKIYNNYTRLNECETILLQRLMQITGECLNQLDSNSRFDLPSQEILFKAPCRKFSTFKEKETYSRGHPNNSCILYKFDGHKGRILIIGNGCILYFDDLNNLQSIQSNVLSFASRIIFQIEFVRGNMVSNIYNAMIIVDIIGAYIGNQLYVPEPMDVINFFELINTYNLIKKNLFICLPIQGMVKVFTQYKLKENTPNSLYQYDGYIVINDFNIFKFKSPTIDALLLNGYLHLEDRKDALSNQTFPHLEENKIYEIGPEIGTSLDQTFIKYVIYRKRKDRTYSSTSAHYDSFIEDIKFFRRYMNQHN